MKATKNNLYLELIQTTRDYLGLAAERFIDRQIQNHLNIEPSEIGANDLKRLIGWIRVAMSLLTENQIIVDDYCQQLETLVEKYGEGS